ncbi:MAG: hypothetical protein ACTSXA_10625 [Candidatus Heimdallarchaeota archaeon]
MAELKINLEEGNGLYMAHVVDFLGCYAKAETRSEVIDALLKDVKKYSEWLLTKEAGKFYKKQAKSFLAGINELVISEEFTGVEKLGELKGASSLFSSETGDLPEEEFENYIKLINCLPEDLLRIVFQYSFEDREKVIIEGKPTINHILLELYITELFYISIFGEEIESKFLESINLTKDELESLTLLERIVKVRQGVIAILRTYYLQPGNSIFTSSETSELPGKQWTTKKVIRKFLEHERDCINRIRELVNTIEINSKATSETTEN